MDERRKKREYLRRWRLYNRLLNESFKSYDNEDQLQSENEQFLQPDINCGLSLCSIQNNKPNHECLASSFETSISISSSSSSELNLRDFEIDSEDISLADSECSEKNLVDDLAKWILKYKIPRSASNGLPELLRFHGHDDLPKCTRTVLQTPRTVLSEKKGGGDYTYLGLADSIIRTLNAHSIVGFENNTISLIINVDGVPLYKSTSMQAWPILSMFNKISPFVVAVYVGESKPSNVEEFLKDFLHEYASLVENGFQYNQLRLNIKILAFVCDAPARQFLKSIKSHNGYHSCERCMVQGEYESSRIVFHDLNSHLRDDELFNNCEYMGTHQIRRSILCDYSINCVSQFPLDYMHLVCLGVMKRLLLSWCEGPRPQKLSPRQIKQISTYLEQIKGQMPSEFERQPRSLDHVRLWKATEYRQFLLYTGCAALKDVLSAEAYKHFLCLSIAVNIYLDEDDQIRNEFHDYAHNLLRYFVSSCSQIYGPTFTTYNVHNLIHLSDDSKCFQLPLDSISSFPFENYLQVVKKFVRKTENPLSQIVKRIGELENFSMSGTCQKFLKTKISKNDKNSWFCLRSGDFVQVREIHHALLVCDLLPKRHYRSIFKEPCDSMIFNIVFVRNINTIKEQRDIGKEMIFRKAICLPFKEGYMIRSILNNVNVS